MLKIFYLTFLFEYGIIIIEKGKENPKHQKGLFMKYVENFEAWALEKYRQFKTAQESNPNIISAVSSVTRTVAIVDLKNRKTSFSKCHKCDTFNMYVGYGVAWAKYIGEEIPKQTDLVKISELNVGQKFALSPEPKEKQEFYYIGYNPVTGTSIAVNAISGVCHQFGVNLRVTKI